MADQDKLKAVLEQVLDVLERQRGLFPDGLVLMGTLTKKGEARAEAWSGPTLYGSEQRPPSSTKP